MSFIELCVRRPVGVTVTVAMLLLFGLLSLTRVPIELTPNVDQPVITVTTRWFGASPQELVRDVIEKQEDVLKSVTSLREMTSEASEGQASIRLEFIVGIDKDAALNEVRDKLRQVPDYPADVDEPIVEATDATSRDWIAWMIVRPVEGFVPSGPVAPGFDGDITLLGDFFTENVKPILERAAGVSEIQVLGGRLRELQVRVNLEQLAARGLSIQQVAAALRSENVDVTAGTVAEGKRDVSIRVVGQFTDPEQVRQSVITWTADNVPVFVSDVAEVELSFKKETTFVRSRGVPVMAMNAQRETGTNVLVVMNELREAIRRANDEVLAPRNWGIEIHQIYDQTVYINDSVGQAGQNLAIGAVLAGLVLFATLRSLGATLVVMVAIPISIIGTVLGMTLFGRSLNVISLSGLTFAVGMGIDNAIVVLENIFRHREMGKDRLRAAVDGANEVLGAVIASTLTNVAVFLPIILIQEEAGQLFRDMSVALTISFFIYLFVAPTVIPMLATLFLRKMPGGLAQGQKQTKTTFIGRITAPIGRFEKWISESFYKLTYYMTGGLLRRLSVVTVMIVTSIGLAWWLMPPTDYLPNGNQNLVFGILAPPPGYNVDEFRSMATDVVEPRVRAWWEAKPGSPELAQLQDGFRQQLAVGIAGMEAQIEGMRQQMQSAGASAEEIAAAITPQLAQVDAMRRMPPPPAIDNFFFVSFGPNVFMGASSTDRQNVMPLASVLTGSIQGIPGTFGFFMQAGIFPTARAGGGGLEINVVGDDLDRVNQAALAVQMSTMQALNEFPRAEPANFNLGRSETQIFPDRVRAASAGVNPADIRAIAQTAVDGWIIGEFRDRSESIDLTLVTSEGRTGRFSEDLRNVPIPTRSGQTVPLASVADFVETTAPQMIRRVEEQAAVKLSVQLPQGLTLTEATATVQSQVIEPLTAAGVLGGDVTVRLAGSADKLTAFRAAFIPGFIVAAIVTYLLLAMLFESLIHPFTIIMSVPFAMVGGLVALAALHAYNPQYKLDVLTMLGFVILIGTIINSPILIVYQALNFFEQGMTRRESIARSTQTRVRPIFMSVVTSVAGLAPLVIFGGAGSELYRGLGAVLVGGLALSTFFTLFLTPMLMSLMLDLEQFIKRLIWGDPDQPAKGASRSRERDDAAVTDDAELVTARLATDPGNA